MHGGSVIGLLGLEHSIIAHNSDGHTVYKHCWINDSFQSHRDVTMNYFSHHSGACCVEFTFTSWTGLHKKKKEIILSSWVKNWHQSMCSH